MGLLPPDSRHADPVIQRLLDWLRGFAVEIVTSIFGAAGVNVRFAADAVTYPGGSQISSTNTVSHGLGKTPVAILLTSRNPDTVISQFGTPDATTFPVSGATRDESSPAAGTVRNFYWLAIG